MIKYLSQFLVMMRMRGVFEKNQCVCFLDLRSKYNHDTTFSYETRDYYLLNQRNKSCTQSEFLIPREECKGVLKIMISVTGSGMTEESLKQLFQKFSQVSNGPNKRKWGQVWDYLSQRKSVQKWRLASEFTVNLERGPPLYFVPHNECFYKTRISNPEKSGFDV